MLVSDSAKGDVVCDDLSWPGPAREENIVDDALLYAHKEKDFISLLSSTPGQFVSNSNMTFSKTHDTVKININSFY